MVLAIDLYFYGRFWNAGQPFFHPCTPFIIPARGWDLVFLRSIMQKLPRHTTQPRITRLHSTRLRQRGGRLTRAISALWPTPIDGTRTARLSVLADSLSCAGLSAETPLLPH